MRKFLLGSAVAVALLTGCGDDKKESTKTTEVQQEVKKEEVAVVKQEAQTPATPIQNETPVTQKVSQEVKETTKEESEKIEEPKETTTTIVETKEKIIIAPEKVEAEIKENTEVANQETPAIDASALYAACGSCHGQKAEKSALGKSQIIAGWEKQKIISALNGYKDGTYGGVMKNIMAGQVNTKTEAEIDALADLISKM